MITLSKIPRIVKHIDSESTLVDARGWSQARLCNHIVWKGADRRAEPRRATVTLHCLEGCGGKGVRGEEKPQEAGKSTELEVGKLGAW